jgi:hypothetical protein
MDSCLRARSSPRFPRVFVLSASFPSHLSLPIPLPPHPSVAFLISLRCQVSDKRRSLLQPFPIPEFASWHRRASGVASSLLAPDSTTTPRRSSLVPGAPPPCFLAPPWILVCLSHLHQGQGLFLAPKTCALPNLLLRIYLYRSTITTRRGIYSATRFPARFPAALVRQ